MKRSVFPRSGAAVPTLFTMVLVASFATRSPWLFAIYGGVALAVVLSQVSRLGAMATRERTAVLVLVGAVTIMLPIAALRNESALLHYCATLISLAAAWLLTRSLKAYHVASRRLLMLAQLIVLVYLASTGLEGFPLEDLLEDSSSNGVTSYLVLLQANHAVATYRFRRRTSLVTALVTLAICIVGYGRGSLLAATGIVMINALTLTSIRRPATAVLAAFAVIGAATALFMAYEDEVVTFVEVNTKIGSGLEDGPRQQIMTDYLSRLNAGTVLVGADYRGTSIVQEYGSNPHNSYIRAHNVFGLPYLLAILAFPLALAWGRLDHGAAVFGGAIVLLVLFRAFTEPIFFPTPFDFFYFAMAFTLARNGKSAPAERRR